MMERVKMNLGRIHLQHWKETGPDFPMLSAVCSIMNMPSEIRRKTQIQLTG